MSTKQEYFHISYFERYLEQLRWAKKSFTVVSTTYTKKIIFPEKKVFFNDRGDQDMRLLSLISQVREDATKFLESGGEVRDEEISFFNMFEVPAQEEVICKIDLTAAYWTYAVKRGIISKKTNETLIRLYGLSKRKLKQKVRLNDKYGAERERLVYEFKLARLKALGSLATTKETREYELGVLVGDPQRVPQPTKPVYMEICRGVDELMRECQREVPGCIYYYWDCIFVKKEFSGEVLEFFKAREYQCTMEETRIDFVRIGDIGYLISSSDDKIYMTRKENRHLIIQDDDKE